MSILLIIGASPWGSSLANTALRYSRAAAAEGHEVKAVFFHGDGVYNACSGRQTDHGAVDLSTAWNELEIKHGTQLMLCSGSSARRMSPADIAKMPNGFREAGLVEMLDLMAGCDQVLTF